jgi:hypothetical protein
MHLIQVPTKYTSKCTLSKLSSGCYTWILATVYVLPLLNHKKKKLATLIRRFSTVTNVPVTLLISWLVSIYDKLVVYMYVKSAPKKFRMYSVPETSVNKMLFFAFKSSINLILVENDNYFILSYGTAYVIYGSQFLNYKFEPWHTFITKKIYT